MDESTERAYMEQEKAVLEARLKELNVVLNERQDEDK